MPRMIICLLFAAVVGCPAAEGPRLLTGQGYLDATQSAIASARDSLDLVLYACVLPEDARVDHPVRRLCAAVVDAHARGVAVRVVLDGETRRDGSIDDTNDSAARWLATRGVPVRRDEPDRRTHSKSLCIDGRTVIIGSTNWTWSAFHRNREQAVMLDDPGLAQAVSSDFDTLWAASTPQQ